MNPGKSTNKDLYYTQDHEWIDFKGTVAYVGICSFKLIGFKHIHQIAFNEPSGFLRQREVIATIKYKDYQIKAHMPVAGKVSQVNEELLQKNPNTLLQYAESIAWIAVIIPSQPYDRTGLLLSKQYQLNGKSKYAK